LRYCGEAAIATAGKIVISDHAYDMMLERGILSDDAITGISGAISLEDYPDADFGPSLLALQRETNGHEAVPAALRRGDLKAAAALARVYELTPVAARRSDPRLLDRHRGYTDADAARPVSR
jgi:hypothetical protein